MCTCRVAHANSLSPYVYFWPGVVSLTLVYAFPASLLVAFIERPFLAAAGIRRRPLVLSLRANFLSTIAGILLIPIGYPALYTIGPLWSVIAFAVSCTIEVSYLRRRSEQAFSRGWVIGGNAVSSAILLLLPLIAIAIEQNNRQWAWFLESHMLWLNMLAVGISVAVFLGSFALPVAAKPVFVHDDSIPATSHDHTEPEVFPNTMETADTV